MSPDPAPNAPPDNWAAQAACLGADPDTHFPEKGGSTLQAKAICAGCPVTVECLDYALDNDERFGVWGGLSERERRRLISHGLPRGGTAQAAVEARQRTQKRLESIRTNNQPATISQLLDGDHDETTEDLEHTPTPPPRPKVTPTPKPPKPPKPTNCPDCNGPAGNYRNGRCNACYQWSRQGRRRTPADREPEPRECDNCGRRLFRGQSRRHGRCETCARYWDRNGTERPKHALRPQETTGARTP